MSIFHDTSLQQLQALYTLDLKFHGASAASCIGFEGNFLLLIQQSSVKSCWFVNDTAFVRPAHTAANFPPAGLCILKEEVGLGSGRADYSIWSKRRLKLVWDIVLVPDKRLFSVSGKGVMTAPTHSWSASPKLLISYLFSISMCAFMYMYSYICLGTSVWCECVHVYVCMCPFTWRPKVQAKNHLPLPFHLNSLQQGLSSSDFSDLLAQSTWELHEFWGSELWFLSTHCKNSNPWVFSLAPPPPIEAVLFSCTEDSQTMAF